MPRRLLALETSGQAGSVAAFEGDTLLAERGLKNGQRSAQSLAPAIRAVLDDLNWRPADINVVAVTTGPGSFTGLRVGVTTAKAFAYAVGAEVIGVNTLAVIAEQTEAGSERLWAVIDAQRRELFAAGFDPQAGAWRVDIPTATMSRDAWLAALRAGDQVTGPGLTSLRDHLPPNIIVSPESVWSPTAASVGRTAIAQYEAGRRDDLWSLSPQYYRRSAAEEKWEQSRQSSPHAPS